MKALGWRCEEQKKQESHMTSFGDPLWLPCQELGVGVRQLPGEQRGGVCPGPGRAEDCGDGRAGAAEEDSSDMCKVDLAEVMWMVQLG